MFGRKGSKSWLPWRRSGLQTPSTRASLTAQETRGSTLIFLTSDEQVTTVTFTSADEANLPEAPNETEVEDFTSASPTILKLALFARLDISHSCGGFGSCGTCRVVIESGLERLAARNEVEAEIADERGFKECERLACQTHAMDQIKARIP